MTAVDEAEGAEEQALHATLVAPELLHHQMDAIHEAASDLVLASLIPAIQVAWSDGILQDDERCLILSLARDHGLESNETAMARVMRWLEVPPSPEETKEAIAALRSAGRGDDELARVVDWAQAVAEADGGVFGLRAVSRPERQTLEWLKSALSATGPVPAAPAPAGREPPVGSRLAAVEVMRDFLRDRFEADTAHVDVVPRDVRTMWPQPSPWGADRMPPAVYGVPEAEHRDFMGKIIARYVRSLREGWYEIVRVIAAHPGVAPMDDAELCRLVLQTPFSRFLVPALDEADRHLFAADLPAAERLGAVYKVDHSHLASWTALPRLRVAPTVGLFSLRDDRLHPVAISVRGRVFRPGDGESWARARYFLIQSCSITLVIGVHPFLHFPMDSVIGVSREVFPPEHVLARVIEAHSYLHLPLDYGVSFNARSVAHNHQREIYAPYPVRREDVFHGIADCYSGIAGNSAYPGFRYPMAAPAFPGTYCQFLGRYYDTVLAFCRRIAAHVAPDDPLVTRWGAALADLLPGFPSPESLRNPETLARAVAGFIHSVSVWHSAEHHAYAKEPVNRVPQRLRVDEPTGNDPPVPPEQWLRRVDIARQEMARRMFYEAHTVRRILDVDYGFEDPVLRAVAADFLADLRACDRAQAHRYIDLERIACSLQF